MNTTIENSKRVKEFRRNLIKEIPRFPNNKASLNAIESKAFPDLLIAYISWRLRYVGVRPRKIKGHTVLKGDHRTVSLKQNIDSFLKAVEDGKDLTPYLSIEPHTRGYTPAADPQTPNPDTWADKDFLLNVMGLHHFHLGMTLESAGHMNRTNEILFAFVVRDTFEILGLFDHVAFEYDVNGTMTPERQKIWSIYEQHQRKHSGPGQTVMGGYGGLGITTAGNPVVVTLAVQRHVHIIEDIEPKLDDPAFLETIYGVGGVPSKPKLKWHYNHLDFGLLDEKSRFFAILKKGPN